MKISHYIYFPRDQKMTAQTFLEKVTEHFEASLHYLDYNGGQWSVVVNVEPDSIKAAEAIEKQLKSLSGHFGGEYDGSEAEIG